MLFSRAWTLAGIFLLGNLTPLSAAAPQNSPVTASRPPLLEAAFSSYLSEQGRWAYTETSSWIGVDGQRGPLTVIRFDPSQPPSGQYVPLKIRGEAPNEKMLKEWAEHGEKEAKRRQKNVGDDQSPDARERDFRIQINREKVTPLLDRATLIAEDATSVTYDIPLRKEGGPNAPLFDAYQLTARVNKARAQFEHATLRQLKPFRIVFGKYSDGLNEIDFAQPDARFGAVEERILIEWTTKPLFGKAVRPHSGKERTDLKRVTPYEERFGVKIGPLRTLEF